MQVPIVDLKQRRKMYNFPFMTFRRYGENSFLGRMFSAVCADNHVTYS